MLSKLRIGPKLLLAPGIVLLLLILVSCAAWYAMVRQNDSLDTIVGQRAARLRATAELVHAAESAHTDVYQLLTWLGASFASARVAELERAIERAQGDTAMRLRQLDAATRAQPAEQALVRQAGAAHAVYLKAVADVIELARADASTSASAMSKAERAFDTVAARLGELSRHEQLLSEQAARRASKDFAAMATLLPVMVVLSIVLSLAITMAVRRSLLREVEEIGASARDLASGKLQVRAHPYGSDEIAATARVLDNGIRHLNATLSGVLASARAIDSASRQMAVENADLSRRATAQASSLQHTAHSVEELTAVVSQTATSARAANRLAASANGVANRGVEGVERLQRTMGALRRGAGQAATLAGRIDAIANETGRLALNAAVEAGRAGPHGEGFAAVAAEVRVLAQQTAQASRDIADLMVVAVADIDGGSAVAAQAGDSIATIARDVVQVGRLIDAIGSASSEQASGIRDVSSAIVEMDQMSQQNCAMVKAAARAAADLQRKAGGLARTVAGFDLDEVAGSAPFTIPRSRSNGGHLRLASSR